MADLGAMCVWIALALASYGAVGSVLGKLRGSPELVVSAQRASYLTVLALTIATLSLVTLFINRDFEVAYVAAHSDIAMQDHLTWVAFYAGNEGSLLYIAFVLSNHGCNRHLARARGNARDSSLYHRSVDGGVDLLPGRHRVHGQPLRQTALRTPGRRGNKSPADPLRDVLPSPGFDGRAYRGVHPPRFRPGISDRG